MGKSAMESAFLDNAGWKTALSQSRVEPGHHLANKNVELWLMPAQSGKPTRLAQLFGGQGTINVNSWAPDSQRLAFVSYKNNRP